MKAIKVKIELEFWYDTDDDKKAIELAESETMPEEYVTDSFEVLDIRYKEGTEEQKRMYLSKRRF
jgi:hypothetical protein